MAFQPPTRPHSANPHIILNSSIFPRPSSAASNRTKAPSPTKLHSHNRRSHEWEDAWDSGSDHDDDVPTGLKGNGPAPIPINAKGNGNGHQRQSSNGSVVAASWASGSYQHVSHRPVLTTSKTYTEGAIPPPPGTASPTTATGHGESSGSKLPPGGAWELVDPVVEDDEVAPPLRAGKEAIREDVDAILRGSFHPIFFVTLTNRPFTTTIFLAYLKLGALDTYNNNNQPFFRLSVFGQYSSTFLIKLFKPSHRPV
jgi:hypothetical protein